MSQIPSQTKRPLRRKSNKSFITGKKYCYYLFVFDCSTRHELYLFRFFHLFFFCHFVQPKPCHHGGKCIDQLGGYKCDCTGTGYSGVMCQMNIDECASSPCQNEAKCDDQINDYTCACYAGYTGKFKPTRKLLPIYTRNYLFALASRSLLCMHDSIIKVEAEYSRKNARIENLI